MKKASAWILMATVSASGCIDSRVEPAEFSSGLETEHPLSSLELEDVRAWCEASHEYMLSELGGIEGFVTSTCILAGLRTPDPEACRAYVDGCIVEQSARAEAALDVSEVCSAARLRTVPDCDPRYTVADLDRCLTDSIAVQRSLSCDLAGADSEEQNALFRTGLSGGCRYLLDPDTADTCHLFMP